MSETTIDEQRLQRRADTYRYLSRWYHEPDEELVADLEKIASDETLLETGQLCDVVPNLETLRLDYTGLFLGPFEVPAPPYGSTYLDTPDRVMTESTVEVEEWYRQEGLDIDIDEPADHVAAELEFVGVLVLAEREAVVDGTHERATDYARKQYEFLSQHLGRWISELADNMREHAETDFYRILADETQSFVESDGAELATRLDGVDGSTAEHTGGESNGR